jgi:Domain of unknown function (DUF4340)
MMQKKKNMRLLVSLITMLAATVVFYLLTNTDGRLEIDKTLFRVEDPTRINKVTLESSKGKIELNYNGTAWKVNDRFDADRQLVTVLFATLEQAEPKRSSSQNERVATIDRLTREGVKVSLLEESELKQTFYAGGNPEKTLTYFYRQGDKPYVMTIPGYRIYVASILELDENGWRDKRVFNFNWRNFRKLAVSFSADAKEDFEVSQRNRFFDIDGISTDTTRLNNFLDDVSLLTGDGIILPASFPKYDSLLKSSPTMKIVINDIANRNYQLELFRSIPGDPNVVGRVNDIDVMIFDRKKIFRVAKNRSYFKRKAE